MILGTVELGMVYGINNTKGKPNLKNSFDVLDSAWNGGVRELDTAAEYGDSELIIGRYQVEKGVQFKIDTKLPTLIEKDQCRSAFENSCKRLQCKKINILYLRSFEQCKDRMMISVLNNLKEEGKIDHIGVSIYESYEMEYIIDKLPEIDVIQFPFNVFDNFRWTNTELLKQAKQAGKSLYARSVYLQGLLFCNSKSLLIQQMGAEEYITCLQQVCIQEEMSIQQFACKYVDMVHEIDDVIIGCESPSEVIENISYFNQKKMLSMKAIMEIENAVRKIPLSIIDPRKWRNA